MGRTTMGRNITMERRKAIKATIISTITTQVPGTFRSCLPPLPNTIDMNKITTMTIKGILLDITSIPMGFLTRSGCSSSTPKGYEGTIMATP
ncbi:unnamed protein product [Acanthoscelides obtectus]|uniref:Uncharacterized protein n=1 Tax=Acanthoscelides obtectus TaxID=200917 RepID=A0A9P0KEB8_ACAOB|nr:unnamed protein product [Acanthoscelides obtectus]CAK1644809.1 hypothetical protein AOBTE_LOCUS13943 [Acanthoscelides obtectus]